jgi:hypothetical protein
MEQEQDKVMYITSVIKMTKDLVKHLDNYEDVKDIMERNLSDKFNEYGINNAFLGGKPFFLSGKDIERRDSFIIGQSEFYSMNQISESLLVSTKRHYPEDFYSLIKSEHLPRNSFDKPDHEHNSYYVTYPIVVSLSKDAAPVTEDNFNLCVKADIQTSITNMFKEILGSDIEVTSLAMTPYTVLAQEAIFKIIQSEDPNVNGITRVTMSQAISIGNPEKNKRANQPINILYKDGNKVILPCHTYEDLTSVIAVIEKQLELPMLQEANKDFYIQLWLHNYININIAKRTLASMGYEACFARADFKYTIEGDISRLYSDVNNYESKEKELDIISNFGYNVIKFDTGDTSVEALSNNCKEMMIYTQKGKNHSLFDESSKELMTTGIMVSYLSNKNTIIASENFYGDIDEETKGRIFEWLKDKAKTTEVSMSEVDDIVNFNYDSIFNTLLATKPSEGV